MLKYLKATEKTAKSESEAIALALAELGVDESEVNISVIEEATKGFLGLGSKDAKIKAEIIDVSAYVAKLFLKQIFEAMQVEIEIEAKTEDKALLIELTGKNLGVVIGKRGDTLDGLQYLTSLVVNSESEEYIKVTIDAENYREKRANTLLELSNKLAAKVIKTGKKQILEPMNPYERRIIHANLQNNDKVTTYSIGEEPYRKVIIALKNQKAYYTKKPTYSKPSYPKTYQNRYPRPEPQHKASSFEEYISESGSEE